MPQPERMTSSLMPRRGAARPIGEAGAPISAEVPAVAPLAADPIAPPDPYSPTPPAFVPSQPNMAAIPPIPPLQPAVPPRRAPASTATTPMTVRFDPEMHRRLKEIAFFEGTSIAAIIEQATKEWMARRGEG
jgi:hypothetical protein